MSNTFGGTHNYWLQPDPTARTFRAAAAKSLYVSPFMPVDLDYAFAFTTPGSRLVAHMQTSRAGRGRLRRDAVAGTPRVGCYRTPACVDAVSRYDDKRDSADSLAGVEVVVEGRAAVPRVPGVSRVGVKSMLTHWAKTAFLSGLEGLSGGVLTLECPDRTYRFGSPGELNATLTIRDERFFLRALTGSDIGLGESFMDGDWTTPDLVPLVRLMLRNRRALDGQNRLTGAVHRFAGGVARRLRDNSLAGSRRHVRRHYDIGNDFFRVFLDTELLMYSCGYFGSAADTLEQAQMRKVDRVCRALKLSPTDRVLEIGSGWGGFAVWAATHYGCRVTTTTISDEQYRHVCEWRSRIGEAGSRIDVRQADYRELTGRFDKVVSIEMFEAVGLATTTSTSRPLTGCSRRTG